jgi:hypothetical protein
LMWERISRRVDVIGHALWEDFTRGGGRHHREF